MRKSRSALIGICTALGTLALILDSRTALEGAAQGVSLCIRSVIPALFPFFVLSAMFTGKLAGIQSPITRPLGKLCGIPEGGESILLAGLLGGYPVGAQCISQGFAAGNLSKADARRMLGFCCNAGPAFIFGMSGILFQNKSVPSVLWIIHILSALITGVLLPCKSYNQIRPSAVKQVNTGQVVQTALRGMATVCAWVILFRTVLSFADRWFLWLLPQAIQIVFTGVLELTNGYLDLALLQNERLRFLLASIFLAFGGVCVILQTSSITGQADLDMGLYFPGKLLQTSISAVLSYIASGYLFSDEPQFLPLGITMVTLGIVILCTLLKIKQNSSSILQSSGV